MYFAVTQFEEGIQFCHLIITEPLNLYINMLSIEINAIVHLQILFADIEHHGLVKSALALYFGDRSFRICPVT